MNALPSPHTMLRPMTVRDLDAVLAIEVAAYPFPWSRGNFVDSLAAGHLAEVLETDEPIGYYVALAGVDEMHLLNITVATRWQGMGYGSLMLDAVRRQARSRGFEQLWLEVRASNVRARSLYARRGFMSVGARRGYYPAAGGREDAIVMSLTLHPGGRDDLD
jgi:ribosomal-protein-alanine N-acetyltransferase